LLLETADGVSGARDSWWLDAGAAMRVANNVVALTEHHPDHRNVVDHLETLLIKAFENVGTGEDLDAYEALHPDLLTPRVVAETPAMLIDAFDGEVDGITQQTDPEVIESWIDELVARAGDWGSTCMLTASASTSTRSAHGAPAGPRHPCHHYGPTPPAQPRPPTPPSARFSRDLSDRLRPRQLSDAAPAARCSCLRGEGPVSHHVNEARRLGKDGVVRRRQDARPVTYGVGQSLTYERGPAGVLVRRRLVKDEHLRPDAQRADDRDALLLTERRLPRVAAEQVRDL